jgi:hypothetical protein
MKLDIERLTSELLDDDGPDMAGAVTAVTGGSEMPPAADTPKTYTVRGMGSLVMDDRPPLDYLWNGIALVAGGVVEIIGAPGIGKSRVVADLARHQILGREFGGRATFKTPLKWLFAGSENGIHRLDFEAKAYFLHRKPSEVRGMSDAERLDLAAANGYTKADFDLLDANFRTFTLEDPEDFDISLMSEANVGKLVETLKAESPRILAVDPWGDIIAGKELDDGDVRSTIRILRGCLAKAGIRDALLVVVNHARMGAKEEANARGVDEGNFGKNSKCIYSIARYVINIRRASFDDNPDIELINAKNNDGKKQPPIALRLDPDAMSYNLVENFNHDAWQAELDEAAGNHPKNGGKTKTDKDKIWLAILETLEEADGGALPYGDIIKVLVNNHGIGKSAAENYLTSCATVGKTISTTAKMKEGKDGTWTKAGHSTLYGLPEYINTYEREHPKGVRC